MPIQGDKEHQLRKFSEAARELGCEEDESAFDEKLRAIARQRPKPEGEKPKPKKPGQ